MRREREIGVGLCRYQGGVLMCPVRLADKKFRSAIMNRREKKL